jgi:hypothetical protein
MEIQRPLFPEEVYARLSSVSTDLESSSLFDLICKSFKLEDTEITTVDEAEGTYWIWNEKERIRVGDIHWLTNQVDAISVTEKRVVILTAPIDGQRLLAILSTSDVVTEDIFSIIYDAIKQRFIEVQETPLELTPSIFRRTINEHFTIKNLSIEYATSRGPIESASINIRDSSASNNEYLFKISSEGTISSLGMTTKISH